ncbi:hypothetical protein NP233_g10216 [Leucocoprinus birnbaumii]|uniref:Uncharacterized protein n=1 Tax=Leucocoprinus birnbaumii TaxID=56174 RepID=A0AAD5VIN5_9AGAR|nr:hypothetical protein NP233_g10216 [Leucocoprinus birnbaumii]
MSLTFAIQQVQKQSDILPYGAIGTTCHLLTAYTLICIQTNRLLWWPFSSDKLKLTARARISAVLSTIGFLISTPLAIHTTAHCRNSRALYLIGIDKVFVSVMNGATACYASFILVVKGQVADSNLDSNHGGSIVNQRLGAAMIIPFICVPGFFVGLVGALMIVIDSWSSIHPLRLLTLGFILLILFEIGLFFLLIRTCGTSMFICPIFVVPILFPTIISYQDWVLALATGNLIGVPSPEVKSLYWSYFVFTRFSMFAGI